MRRPSETALVFHCLGRPAYFLDTVWIPPQISPSRIRTLGISRTQRQHRHQHPNHTTPSTLETSTCCCFCKFCTYPPITHRMKKGIINSLPLHTDPSLTLYLHVFFLNCSTQPQQTRMPKHQLYKTRADLTDVVFRKPPARTLAVWCPCRIRAAAGRC